MEPQSPQNPLYTQRSHRRLGLLVLTFVVLLGGLVFVTNGRILERVADLFRGNEEVPVVEEESKPRLTREQEAVMEMLETHPSPLEQAVRDERMAEFEQRTQAGQDSELSKEDKLQLLYE